MNIKQTLLALETAGFSVERERGLFGDRISAVKRDATGGGIRVHLYFGEQAGRNGKPLIEALANCFPLMGPDRLLLSGAKSRDFAAGRTVSGILGGGCTVRTNGCTSAVFEGGELVRRF